MHTYIKVRGYHLDFYQHVNNARYLEFLEEARWEWLENLGRDADLVVMVDCQIPADDLVVHFF